MEEQMPGISSVLIDVKYPNITDNTILDLEVDEAQVIQQELEAETSLDEPQNNSDMQSDVSLTDPAPVTSTSATPNRSPQLHIWLTRVVDLTSEMFCLQSPNDRITTIALISDHTMKKIEADLIMQ